MKKERIAAGLGLALMPVLVACASPVGDASHVATTGGLATGGGVTTGGTADGGTQAGGASTGGVPDVGGSSAGGNTTGGLATGGGVTTGGFTASGGSSPTGGASTGGVTGGTSTGGTATGGLSETGGVASGGEPGGASSGGTAAGGTGGIAVFKTCQFGLPCATAADCCSEAVAAAGYTCGEDYPYLYACVEGVCQSQQCSSDAQCDAYFAVSFTAGGYTNRGCENGVCSVVQACSVPSECCPAGLETLGLTCGEDYPYLYACSDGACVTQQCTSDTQCTAWFDYAYAASGYENLGCDGGICQISQPQDTSCESDEDCCIETYTTAGYACGEDYPNLYACVDGQCVWESCTADTQCDAYYQATYASAGYVSLGCR